jgi:hypothetical protein
MLAGMDTVGVKAWGLCTRGDAVLVQDAEDGSLFRRAEAWSSASTPATR